MKDYKIEYEKWLTSDVFDQSTKEELKVLSDEKEIEDRFYKEITFGTAGIRGIMGAGTNRVNKYTMGKATQGLANYINKKGEKGGVVIGYDSRLNSKEYAIDSARILTANGIKVYLFDFLVPTPEVSFAIRYLKATAGINITASHNPPEYNGYKCSWKDGAQICGQVASEIVDSVNVIKDYGEIKRTDEKEAEKIGLLRYVGKEIEDEYIEKIKGNLFNKQIIKEKADEIKVVYSPFCGTGKLPALRLFRELGVKNVYTVKEQSEPQGKLSSLKYPNIEDKNAYEPAIKLAVEKDADIILVNDSDADRLVVHVKGKKAGEYVALDGNMSGCLMLEYVLSQLQARKKLPENGAVISSMVSSKMAKRIAERYKLAHFDVLTGFKNVGKLIKEFEDDGKYKFVYAFEESYGCLYGDHVRDKDGIMAIALMIEATAYYKKQGCSLIDVVEKNYKTYDYYKGRLFSLKLSGKDGAEKIESVMKTFRESDVKKIGDGKVLKIKDYLLNKERDLIYNTEKTSNLPKSNVLFYELENDNWLCVRPSGTEPKIRFYFEVKGKTEEESEKLLQKRYEEIKKIADEKIN